MASAHIHRYFLEKDAGEIVSDLQTAGCVVEYEPGRLVHGAPKSAFLPQGSIADCRHWTDTGIPIPLAAKTCLELSSTDVRTESLVKKLYDLPIACKTCFQ